jgi:hypothetical protein
VRPRTLPPVALPMAIALGGLVLAFAGGLGRRGALDLTPCLDGVFTSGLVAIAALLLQGHSTRFSLAVVAPIVAIAVPGYMKHHPLPLVPLGAEIAVIGAIAALVEILRAPRSASDPGHAEETR